MSDFLPQIPIAFASGLISVLSPCVLPLMPAYLSLISGISVHDLSRQDPSKSDLAPKDVTKGDPSPNTPPNGAAAVAAGAEPTEAERRARRAQRIRVMEACLGFVSGFSIVFIVLGATAFALGRVLRTWHVEIFGFELGMAQLAGIVIIVFGLHMAGFLRLSWLLRDRRFEIQGAPGFGGAFLVGAGFGFGWSPCIGPILGTVLTLAGSRETVFEGITLLAVYSAGLGVPFLVAGYSLDAFFGAFQRIKRHFRALEIGSGVLLMGVGILLVTNQLAWFNGHFVFLAELVVRAEDWLQ
ncbi:MAG: cytochrome c biogenesis protein CcdA [Deltaproteobacteria bacterium]|nr:cytochrome c biogenesis protein CcdA [Deltaproteobacteria bacterium]